MITRNISQISKETNISTMVLPLLLCNIDKFPCAAIPGKGRKYIINQNFFKNLKEAIQHKIETNYNRKTNYQEMLKSVNKWEKEILLNANV